MSHPHFFPSKIRTQRRHELGLDGGNKFIHASRDLYFGSGSNKESEVAFSREVGSGKFIPPWQHFLGPSLAASRIYF